jgi:hypothetical protein
MGVPTRVPKISKTAVHFLLEGLFIVISVGLGFAMARYSESRSNRELGAVVLQSLRAEVEHNRTTLAPYIPMHTKWLDALGKTDTVAPEDQGRCGNRADNTFLNPPERLSCRTGVDVFFATRPPLPANAPSPFPFLQRSAWDAALTGGTLRFIQHDIVTALSDLYVTQEVVAENIARLANGPFSSAATFDVASREPSVRVLWMTLADIASAEDVLLRQYQEHLPAITAATAEH